MSDLMPADLARLQLLDFEPICSSKTCNRTAAWMFECVYSCGMDGLLCEEHHALLANSFIARRCKVCGNQAPFRNMVIFRPLGGS